MASPALLSSIEILDPLHKHRKAIHDACASGYATILQQLFLAAGVKQGYPAVEPQYIHYPDVIGTVPPSGPPPTTSMKAWAVGT